MLISATAMQSVLSTQPQTHADQRLKDLFKNALDGLNSPLGPVQGNNAEKSPPSYFNVFMSSTRPGAGIYIEDQARIAELATRDLEVKLSQFFAEHNIATPPAVEWKSLPDGRMQAIGHPESERINTLMKEYPGMENDVREVFCMNALVAELNASDIFNEHYRNAYASGGQKAALAVYEHFTSIPEPEVRLLFDGRSVFAHYNGKTLAAYLGWINKHLA